MKITSIHLLLLSLVLVLPVSLSAGIFDDPENLEVLPEDISAEQLRATMRGFAMGTGHRCSSCHVGEEGDELDTYDFASDEKEDKQVARAMLQMVNEINATLDSDVEEDHVVVTCLTCHRGIKAPRMTADVLTKAADSGGIPAMEKTYRELRERYYGTHSYDFSDMTLTGFAQSRALAGQPDQAKAFLDIILADNPGSFNAHFLYGELDFAAGDKVAAAKHWNKALELNPRAAPFLQPKIDQLGLE